MRLVLRSPAGRLLPGLALLEFEGRRTGRRYRVPVGWHTLGSSAVVLTPAPWRHNFAGGAPVTVHRAGSVRALRGTLEPDTSAGAKALARLLAEGERPGNLGLHIRGNAAQADLQHLGRWVIHLEPR
jgi:hypothetical protein